jgi:hypothetical protein
MLRRRQTNADQAALRPRSTVAAATDPLRRALWAVEDRFVWEGRDALRRAFDVVRWPFEQLVWVVEQRLVWPLRERVAGWSAPARAAAGGALAAVAIGAVALGAVLATTGGGESAGRETLAATELSATGSSTSPSEPAPAEPVLQGAAPVLGLDGAVATAQAPDREAAGEQSAEGTDASSESAAASSSKVVPAGPAAMKVARRFAEAFVVYEVGEQPARARAAFDATAVPALAGALAKRPPRLPEKVKVPQAKVVNLVPGPRRGKAYSVSVSLLRVGVTSELRLELKKNQDGWLVTDVRG